MKKKQGEPVRADRSYTTLQLAEAACVSPLIIRAAVRAGLPFTTLGKGRHFTGAAWIAWLASKQITYQQGRKDGPNPRSARPVASVLEPALS